MTTLFPTAKWDDLFEDYLIIECNPLSSSAAPEGYYFACWLKNTKNEKGKPRWRKVVVKPRATIQAMVEPHMTLAFTGHYPPRPRPLVASYQTYIAMGTGKFRVMANDTPHIGGVIVCGELTDIPSDLLLELTGGKY